VWRIRNVYPGSWFLPIPDPKTATKERGEKIFCHTFLCSHKCHKIEHYFSFEVLKKKIWANFQRIIELLPQKIVTKPQKYGLGIRDPGSGKNLFRIPDPGVKKAPEPGSGSETLDPVLFWPLDPGSGMGRKSASGSGMNNPDHIFQSFETIFLVFLGLKYFDADPGWKNVGSGINIPDPQHCLHVKIFRDNKYDDNFYFPHVPHIC
jgi:hypothetical protein